MWFEFYHVPYPVGSNIMLYYILYGLYVGIHLLQHSLSIFYKLKLITLII